MKNIFKASETKKGGEKGGEEISRSKLAHLMVLTELIQGVVLVTESLLKLKKK